jgi:A/G-specific adenine glycosylase
MPAELLRKRSSSSARRRGGAVPAAALRRDLIAWYRRAARDLPWRRTRDPWAIWVSEVMLQQTQVKTALPYYPRFLERFPSPAALARASEPRVLAAWSGLGYYRRARQLRAAAQQVVREHGGLVPSDADAFGRLPGVGRYTRAAVLSIGFGAPLAVLDGNVARVLSRVFALPAAVRDPRGARALWALAESMVPARGAGEWNQALMELGAVVCTARAPRCGECPLKRHCRALALGRVAEFPPVTPRRAALRVRRAVALISRGGRMLVTQRRGALLNGLWEPPGVELGPGEDARRALAAELARLGVHARIEPAGKTVSHAITHRAIRVEVWRGSAAKQAPGLAPAIAPITAARFVDVRRARPALPLTGLAIKLLRTRSR